MACSFNQKNKASKISEHELENYVSPQPNSNAEQRLYSVLESLKREGSKGLGGKERRGWGSGTPSSYLENLKIFLYVYIVKCRYTKSDKCCIYLQNYTIYNVNIYISHFI